MKLLALRNNGIKVDFAHIQQFLSSKFANVAFELEYKDIQVPVDFMFLTAMRGRNWFGISVPTMQRLRQYVADDVEIVYFVYDPASQHDVANYSNGDLVNNALLVQLPYKDSFGQDYFNGVLEHETGHTLGIMSKNAGYQFIDTLDSGGSIEDNYRRLPIKILDQILSTAKKVISLVQTSSDKIKRFAQAIQKYEGWSVTSVSFANNNPGNIRYIGQSNATLGKNGFARYKTYEDGFGALCSLIRNACLGKSSIYAPTDTIAQFFQKYAPSTDNNNPDAYAQFVANKVGVPVSTRMKALL